MTFQDPNIIEGALRDSRTIAVVGLSADPQRPSWEVAHYLQQHGYRIIPVNPNATEILGEKCYAALTDIPEPVDLVDVFRRPPDCLDVARQAVAIRAKTLWLQLGIVNHEAAALAQKAGLNVVMDACTKIEHRRRNLG